MSELRVFSYLPNPRIWKATIAARLNGVEVEVIGASPKELQSWLWDFDARPLTTDDSAQPGESTTGKVGFTRALRKTAAFLEAHPFGTVPTAFSPPTGSVFSSLTASCAPWRASARITHCTVGDHMKLPGWTAFSTRVLSLCAIPRSICWVS